MQSETAAALRALLIPVVCMVCSQPAHAIFMRPEFVPTKRLLQNTETFLKQNPQDAQAHYTLARIHYLAFANRSIIMASGRDPDRPSVAPDHLLEDWQYYERQYEAQRRTLDEMRLESFEGMNDQQQEAYYERQAEIAEQLDRDKWQPQRLSIESAAKHAVKAEMAFVKAIELEPHTGLFVLGRASLHDQFREFARRHKLEIPAEFAKVTPQSIADLYLQAFEKTADEDARLTHIPLAGLQSVVSFEAAGAILARLDQPDVQLDASVIKRVKDHLTKMKALERGPITPIILATSATTTLSELVDADCTVLFDLDGDGFARRWQWLQPDAGILVWDPRQQGKVRSGTQLFGSATFRMLWENGYQPLRWLDDDRDGQLARGELDGMSLWFDRNSNGQSEPGEVQPLEKLGVVSLSVNAQPDAHSVLTSPGGVRWADGRITASWDWIALPAGQQH